MHNILHFPLTNNAKTFEPSSIDHLVELEQVLTMHININEMWGHDELQRVVVEYCLQYNIPNKYIFSVWYTDLYDFSHVEVKIA